MKNIPADEFLMNKRDFVLNSLTLGVATEILSKTFGYSPQRCLEYLNEQGTTRMLYQNSQSIEKFIYEYYVGRQNKMKAIIVDLPTNA